MITACNYLVNNFIKTILPLCMHWQCRAFSAEARRDEELSDEEVVLMGYEPRLDVTQQTQLPQLSAVASSKIREIAKICNAQLKADKVSEYLHTTPDCLDLQNNCQHA
jgi:hypothetical protein